MYIVYVYIYIYIDDYNMIKQAAFYVRTMRFKRRSLGPVNVGLKRVWSGPALNSCRLKLCNQAGLSLAGTLTCLVRCSFDGSFTQII